MHFEGHSSVVPPKVVKRPVARSQQQSGIFHSFESNFAVITFKILVISLQQHSKSQPPPEIAAGVVGVVLPEPTKTTTKQQPQNKIKNLETTIKSNTKDNTKDKNKPAEVRSRTVAASPANNNKNSGNKSKNNFARNNQIIESEHSSFTSSTSDSQ